MGYIEYKLSFDRVLSEDESGMYIAELSDIGFDSFHEHGRDISAYITEEENEKNKIAIDAYLGSVSDKMKSVTSTIMPKQNWNSVWESNFEPIVVNEDCVVRAPFHDEFAVKYEVVIMPKMSFGTGHHQTTRLMMEAILGGDFEGKQCLDMGCGTAVLAILAAMRGANSVEAIDIDEWAYENGMENAETNGVADRVTLHCGDASLLGDKMFDVVLANINRNILLNDMSRYVNVLNAGGDIYFSGFLAEDVDSIVSEGERNGLVTVLINSKEKWNMVKMKKNI